MIENDAITESSLEHFRPYLSRVDITDIFVNIPKEVVLKKTDGSKEYINDNNLDILYLNDFASILSIGTGRRFSSFNPTASFMIDNKHRCQVVGEKYTSSKISIAIRINHQQEFSLNDFKITKDQNEEILSFIKNKKNILISAGTGVGKTSFLKALIKKIPHDERIITVEDTREIVFSSEYKDCVNYVYSEDRAEKELKEITNKILRISPERIIFGELRHENIAHFLNCLDTGHPGSMSTIHANSPIRALKSIERRLAQSSGLMEGSYKKYVDDLEGVIDVVIQLHEKRETGKKKVVSIEIHKFFKDEYGKN